MNSSDRFESRNSNFCEINKDQFFKLREDSAVKLRKSKRNQEFAAKRLKKMPGSDIQAEYSNLSRTERLESSIRSLSIRGEEHSALVSLRKLFNQGDISILDRAIASGLLSKLHSLLCVNSGDRILGEVFWIISILSYYGFYEIDESPVLLSTFAIVNEEWEFCLENALWALANLILHKQFHKDLLLQQHRIIDKMERVLFLYRNNLNMTRIASWFVCNLLHNNRSVDPSVSSQILRLCVELFDHQDIEVSRTVLKILKSFSDVKDLIGGIVESRVIYTVLSLVSDSYFEDLPLMVIGNICKFDTEYVEFLLENNLLDSMVNTVCSSNTKLKKETLYIISNLVTNSEDQMRLVVSHRIFYFCLLALDDKNEGCRKEASFIFRNLARMNVKLLAARLLNAQVCLLMKGALQKKESVFLSNILEFLDFLFEVDREIMADFHIIFSDSGCLDDLEMLIHHHNPEIRRRAIDIIDSTYGFEQTDENIIFTNKYSF